MNERGVFLNCLVFSMVCHTVAFVVIPIQTRLAQGVRKPIEVAYVQTGKTVKPEIVSPAPAPPVPRQAPRPEKKSVTELIKKDLAEKPYAAKTEVIPKKSVSMPNVPGEAMKTPEYRSYYQLIREKIRRYAYYYYKKLEEGEIFLTFILRPDGSVKDLAINTEKSTSSAYLRDIAVRSVEEASPYPPFPEKLKNNDRLSFNVVIAYEFK